MKKKLTNFFSKRYVFVFGHSLRTVKKDVAKLTFMNFIFPEG